MQLMQQLMSSNRQRQLQAHSLLLPLAHPQMFKDEAASTSGSTAPELKVCSPNCQRADLQHHHSLRGLFLLLEMLCPLWCLSDKGGPPHSQHPSTMPHAECISSPAA